MSLDDTSIRTFVIRQGRMTDAQKRALSELGNAYIVPYEKKLIEPATLFGDGKPVVMEIGFGMGRATWQIARNRGMYNYLGVEVHAPGVGKLVMDLHAHELTNVKIVNHDAVEVLADMIPHESLAGFHVFYPDPWPKKRHHKRRLMRPALVDLLVSRLAPGGYLYFVTDIEEYGVSTLEILAARKDISNAYEGFAPRIEWRPETRFEEKALEASRTAWELYFTKN
jgi:tRNA (guanine-N7-)-methyltransferase